MLPLSLYTQEINLIFPFELRCSLCFFWLCQDLRIEALTMPCSVILSHAPTMQPTSNKSPRPLEWPSEDAPACSHNPPRDLDWSILLSTTWGAVNTSLPANPHSAGRIWRNIGVTQCVVSPILNTSASRPVFLCSRTGPLPASCLLPLWFWLFQNFCAILKILFWKNFSMP